MMQALARGSQARKRVRKMRVFLNHTAIIIQSFVRMCIASRHARERRAELRQRKIMERAIVDLQRFFRGWKGRQRAAAARKKYIQDLTDHMAATKLQAMVRSDHARKRGDEIRATRLESMNKAATFMRKMWMGARTRKRYRELIVEFRRHEHDIITIQRFVRGFLVRLRMWREAIRAEEELWAVLEMQRVWRGYQGRVRWENAYEEVWRRETSAALVQRRVRGWLARTRVNRMRRRIARAEFDRARKRFRAVQKIQAVVRGYLVRNRRFHLIAMVICVQRAWRAYQRKPAALRVEAREAALKRRRMAVLIQQTYRRHAEGKEVERIQQGGGGGGGAGEAAS